MLKFKVDYNDVRPRFKAIGQEQDLEKLTAAENTEAFLHPERIKAICRYILDNFAIKTHRLMANGKGFNAMLAVASVDAAKAYYTTFKKLQKDVEKPLKIATIFSFATNEEQDAEGDIVDESFDPLDLNRSSKEFLASAINDYNRHFGCQYTLDSERSQDYYRDFLKKA